MTPPEYAKLCAQSLEFQFSRRNLKGRGHDPRVRVDTYCPFLKLVPSQKIMTTRKGRRRAPTTFTCPEVLLQYRTLLLTAGLNPEGHFTDNYHSAILSRRFWQAAVAYHRLSGGILPADQKRANRVAGILKASLTRMHRAYQARPSLLPPPAELPPAVEQTLDAEVQQFVGMADLLASNAGI